MARPRFVTLTTDIGWAYAAQIKAVLARRAPRVVVVDVTHDVPPHSVRDGAFLLSHIAPRFPPGTVHVAVVDPGVGGGRAAGAAATSDGSFLVGPDNGILAPAVRALGLRTSVRIDPTRVAPGGRSSATFEGRDVFAPAAAHLATGGAIGRLGGPFVLRDLELPGARRRPRGVVGEVVHVDGFGNVITSVPSGDLPDGVSSVRVRLGRRAGNDVPLVRSYEAAAPGTLVVLGSSFGLLELAVRNGSAARRLAAASGDGVEFTWGAAPHRGRK